MKIKYLIIGFCLIIILVISCENKLKKQENKTKTVKIETGAKCITLVEPTVQYYERGSDKIIGNLFEDEEKTEAPTLKEALGEEKIKDRTYLDTLIRIQRKKVWWITGSVKNTGNDRAYNVRVVFCFYKDKAKTQEITKIDWLTEPSILQPKQIGRYAFFVTHKEIKYPSNFWYDYKVKWRD